MADLDLAFMPATEQAKLVASGDLSPVELIDNALDRIADVDPALNCFAFVWADEARAAARRAADAVSAGARLGALHGVPIALKDTTPTKGHTTTLGSFTHENWVPDTNAAIAVALEAAGAIVVGKTTSPEFAHLYVTESPLWGVTRNPWNLDRTPGGSSGGSGAAVASGCVSLAEGSDMGGSVRIPAAWCGVVGLKPGLGRIPMDVLPALFDNISHHGPLARTVDEARLFLAVTQGPSDADILSVTSPLDLSAPLHDDVAGIRVALSVDLGAWAVDPSIEAAVRGAAAALADAGAIVTEVDPGLTGHEEEAWDRLWEVFMATYYGHLVAEFRERMDPNVLGLIERGEAMSAVEYKRIEFDRTAMWKRIAPILADHHVLLCPTMAQGPLPASLDGFEAPTPPDDGRCHSPDMTAIFNLISPCPVVTVPCGFDADQMPVGAQIVGRRWDETTVLRVGAAIEAALAPLGRPSLADETPGV